MTYKPLQFKRYYPPLCPGCGHDVDEVSLSETPDDPYRGWQCRVPGCDCAWAPSDMLKKLLADASAEIEKLRADKQAMSEENECACFVDGCPCTTEPLDQQRDALVEAARKYRDAHALMPIPVPPRGFSARRLADVVAARIALGDAALAMED